jgi:hypothetical protein
MHTLAVIHTHIQSYTCTVYTHIQSYTCTVQLRRVCQRFTEPFGYVWGDKFLAPCFPWKRATPQRSPEHCSRGDAPEKKGRGSGRRMVDVFVVDVLAVPACMYVYVCVYMCAIYIYIYIYIYICMYVHVYV